MGDTAKRQTGRRCAMKNFRFEFRDLRLMPLNRLFLVLALAFARLSAHAQSYLIDWFTIDGGGGTSSGGSYSLSGTIGQPDAGTLSGGNYTLEGGFWPGLLVVPSTGEAPAMSIQLAGGSVIV